jgi:hypothetical protein
VPFPVPAATVTSPFLCRVLLQIWTPALVLTLSSIHVVGWIDWRRGEDERQVFYLDPPRFVCGFV